MEEEIKAWVAKAENDLKVAKDNLGLTNYEDVCFHCQQAAEKALKAVYILQKGKLEKVHDLVRLGSQIEAPVEILN